MHPDWFIGLTLERDLVVFATKLNQVVRRGVNFCVRHYLPGRQLVFPRGLIFSVYLVVNFMRSDVNMVTRTDADVAHSMVTVPCFIFHDEKQVGMALR